MHVAIVGSRGYPYSYSGYETFVAALAPRLVERGHEVSVYCHRPLFRDRPSQVRGVRLIYVPTIRQKSLSQLSNSALSTLHLSLRERPDVALFVNSANGPFGYVLRLAGIPCCINVDGLEWLRPKWRGLGARYFKWASKVATRAFDVIIADADAMADVYRREFASESTTIAYGAAVAESTEPDRVRTFGVAPGEYFLVVARLVPDNNGDLIVRGFTRSSVRRKLLVVGSVPYEDAYASAVRKAGDERVIFAGHVSDQDTLKELFCNSYAYVHAHEYGGTNPALLTALGAGCAVAALDTPFNREMLAETKHGVYFDKTEASVSQVLETLEAEPQLVAGMRATARDRIRERYTWDRIIDQYEAMLQRLSSR